MQNVLFRVIHVVLSYNFLFFLIGRFFYFTISRKIVFLCVVAVVVVVIIRSIHFTNSNTLFCVPIHTVFSGFFSPPFMTCSVAIIAFSDRVSINS